MRSESPRLANLKVFAHIFINHWVSQEQGSADFVNLSPDGGTGKLDPHKGFLSFSAQESQEMEKLGPENPSLGREAGGFLEVFILAPHNLPLSAGLG